MTDRLHAREHARAAREALRQWLSTAASVRWLADSVDAYVAYIEELERERDALRAELDALKAARKPARRSQK